MIKKSNHSLLEPDRKTYSVSSPSIQKVQNACINPVTFVAHEVNRIIIRSTEYITLPYLPPEAGRRSARTRWPTASSQQPKANRVKRGHYYYSDFFSLLHDDTIDTTSTYIFFFSPLPPYFC